MEINKNKFNVYLGSRQWINNFSESTLINGRSLFINDEVFNVIASQNKIIAQVDKEKGYRTSININTFDMSCECPSNYPCNHQAALLSFLYSTKGQNILKELNFQTVNGSAFSNQDMVVYKQQFSKLIKENTDSSKNEFINLLKKFVILEPNEGMCDIIPLIAEYLYVLALHEDNDFFSRLILTFTTPNSTLLFIYSYVLVKGEHKRNFSVIEPLIKPLYSITKSSDKDDDATVIMQYYIQLLNGEKKTNCPSYVLNVIYYYTNDLNKMFDVLKNGAFNKISVLSVLFIKELAKTYGWEEISKLPISHLIDESFALKIVKERNEKALLNILSGDCLPAVSDIIINSGVINKTTASLYSIKNLKLSLDAIKKIESIQGYDAKVLNASIPILKQAYVSDDTMLIRSLLATILKRPFGALFIILLCEKEYKEKNITYSKRDQIINYTENGMGIKSFSFDQLIIHSELFDFSFSCELRSSYYNKEHIEVLVRCNFACSLNQPLLQIVFDEDMKPIKTIPIGLESFALMSTYKKVIEKITYNYVDMNASSINSELDILKKQLSKKREAEIIEKSKKALNSFVNKLSSKETNLLIQDFKAHITPYFDDKIDKLFFKIGTQKQYLIRDIINFSELVLKGAYNEYGKDLSMSHNIENFDEESRQIIKNIILINKYPSNYDKRYIPLNKENSDSIFETLKDKNVKIESSDLSVNISLLPLQVSFIINKDGILNNNVKGKVVRGINDIYVLNNFEVFKLDITPENKFLLEFTLENPSFNTSYDKETFINQVYSRYMNVIKLAPEIKNDYKISDINFEVYFDYDDSNISYHIRTSKIISDNEQNSPLYIRKRQFINEILKQYGFIDHMLEDDKTLEFLKNDLSPLKELADVYCSEKLKVLNVKRYDTFKIKTNFNVNYLEVQLQSEEYSLSELEQIYNAIIKKRKYVKLKNNVILDIQTQEANNLVSFVDDFSLDKKNLLNQQTVPIYQALKLPLSNYGLNSTSDEKTLEMIDSIRDYKNQSYKVPKEVKDVLREYQIEAFYWLKTLVKYNLSGVLADDMGLGKSLEMITLIISDEVCKPSLIICPKSLSFNWKNEFLKWNSNIETHIVIGNKQTRKNIIKSINPNKKCVYITSYDSLKLDSELYSKTNFRFTILDEAQAIKNSDSLRAKAVKIIQSDIRFVCTGTPIENNVNDLWSLFDFLLPGYFPEEVVFEKQYAPGSENLKRLSKKISPFILRRTKEEKLKDLPMKFESIITCEMNSEQEALYLSQLDHAKEIAEDPTRHFEVLSSLTRLRQICVDPSLYAENYYGESEKLNTLYEIVKDKIKDGHRILIFSQFVSVFDKISSYFNKNNIKHFVLTGKTAAQERLKLCEEFNKNNTISAGLISLKAGGTGLNLTGADVVIHLDPWWNFSAESQANDRTYRIGQKNNVEVIKLVCENTIEQKVIELQNLKKDFAKKILGGSDANIENLSNEDLQFLFSD